MLLSLPLSDISFMLQPAEFCRANFNVEKGQDYDQEIKFLKGTTTLGFRFQGGVIVSVDSRATQGPYIGKLLTPDELIVMSNR